MVTVNLVKFITILGQFLANTIGSIDSNSVQHFCDTFPCYWRIPEFTTILTCCEYFCRNFVIFLVLMSTPRRRCKKLFLTLGFFAKIKKKLFILVSNNWDQSIIMNLHFSRNLEIKTFKPMQLPHSHNFATNENLG